METATDHYTHNYESFILDDVFNPELFFEISNDLLCIAGYDGYFKRINKSVVNLLGYTEQELLSKPISEFIYPEDKSITQKHRNELIKNYPLLNFENRYVTKTGDLVWLSWTSMPLEDKQLVYAIAKNITHKKKLEEERNILFTNLSKINNDLKQLSYQVSHDLRSPVNNLLSVLNLLDVTKIQDEETIEYISILKLTTEGLKSSLNGFVESISETHDLKIPVERLSFRTSLDEVLRSIKTLIKESNARIEFDFFEAETIMFNKIYLGSIFLNLITNSIKYAKSGCRPSISIVSKKVNGSIRLIYADEGLGFDMNSVKDKVFGLHQRFHDHLDSKGIGLYLIYNHLTSLGGKITVESEVDKGAKFTMCFRGD
jgi:PAS domain S-box-containing protein